MQIIDRSEVAVMECRLLMEHAEKAILQGHGDQEEGARDVIGLAHNSITAQGEKEGAVILGSSTICLGLLRPGGLLEMANVGDSGFRVIRQGETVFASEVMPFCTLPYQCSIMWNSVLSPSMLFE